ncbi:MAG: capsular biosynthesis protein [Deltaproteobacteria bacterium]|nr:capsular biosynthesis protein [Deltaproteobacteria bacterium]HCH65596.1 capsular biosynthesis protein [Deltaproteobacteria bacterium]
MMSANARIGMLAALLGAGLTAVEPVRAQAPPEAAPSKREAGIQALKDGDADTAKALLSEAVAAHPTDTSAWWELGWAHWSRDDFAAAVEAWRTVETLDAAWPDVSEWQTKAQARAALNDAPPVRGDVPMKPSGKRISFAAAGDTMMGSDLRKGARGLADGDGIGLFAGLEPLFRSADVAFLNLEGPLADGLPNQKCGPNSSSCYAFRTPTRYTNALTDLQLDLASLANNHAMDLGKAGMNSTIAALDAADIGHAGRYGDYAIIERNGVKVGLVAAHSGGCCPNVNRPAEVSRLIAEVDAQVDIVVFSFHGGAEGAKHRHVPGRTEIAWGERRGDVQALARAAVDAGADVVFGHGPHVLRAMEVYRGRLIAYSLGNFCGFRQFGTRGGLGGTSLVLEVGLAENGVLMDAKVHPAALNGEGAPRPDPKGTAIEQLNELSAADFPDSGVQVQPDGTIQWTP